MVIKDDEIQSIIDNIDSSLPKDACRFSQCVCCGIDVLRKKNVIAMCQDCLGDECERFIKLTSD